MKVIELLASRHFTGPAEATLQLMEGLARKGHSVLFAHTQSPPGSLAEHASRLPIDYLSDVQVQRKGFVLPGVLQDARLLARRLDPAETVICHVHGSHDHWLGLALAAMRPGRVKLIRSVHETRIARRRVGDIPLFSASDGCIAIGEGMRERLIRSYNLDESRVAVVRGVVDTERYRPGLDASAIRREIDASDDEPIAGIVSRIKPGRGHDFLVEAFSEILGQLPKAKLIIVGRGEGKTELEALVAKLGLSERIRFLGYRREDLPAIYNAMRVKVILGEGSDGTCRAALEAMSCGVPVIAAKVGALEETVTENETGALIDADNKSALAAALMRYLADPVESRRQGKCARQQAEARFTIDRMVADTEKFFLSMLDRDR